MCLACQTQIDPDKMNAFGDRFVNLMNQSALGLMVSIGYRTGLFETMKRLTHSASSNAIADAANLDERYVREWLGCMVAGEIVEVDESGLFFHLPASHAAMLTEGGEGECLAHLAQYFAVLGSVEDKIVDCFKHGGGVPYSAYPRFHEVMALDSRQSVVNALEEHILPLDPEIVAKLEQGAEVLDIGCGQGFAVRALAQLYPNSNFTGYDLSQEAIDFATAEAKAYQLKNASFEVRDLTSFNEDAESDRFDIVTAFDAIHDQARPDHVLEGIRKTLRSDGVFLMQDIAGSSNVYKNKQHPLGPLIYTISCMHCMTVSLAQGGLGLGAAWGEELTTEFIRDAGFEEVTRHALEHDIQNYYYIAR
ncbi:class I SAM-dependent methyltransferase [Pelagicoccus sp. SDUM812003]|uniref:class I SAM-dependent methyltransferase n=1 Tax=Pelagicoccus sp. SDUM812003 TaxID=3041267 RepID=UPI00280F6A71|nr:class I SAM-dependent methyltransferase [Pelagicoccus sp. SDUM812003]MDQ8203001.1 class I SAM-dependent methyltransferase [Pelagicoccus sp. SDUM812003]